MATNNERTSEKKNTTKNKGETEPRTHKGGPNASNSKKVTHEKDDSNGTDRSDTKKNPNSI